MIAADCIGGGKTLGSLEGAEEVIVNQKTSDLWHNTSFHFAELQTAT